MRIKLSIKNALILICIVYTVLTITSSGISLLQGQTTDTHTHLLMRFAVTFIGIGSILIFNLFPEWPLTAIYGLHYAVTMAAIFILVWVSGFFIDLHPDAYRDIFLNFTIIYILLAAVLIILGEYRKKSKQNRGVKNNEEV